MEREGAAANGGCGSVIGAVQVRNQAAIGCAERRASNTKKRHVEVVTRLPTKRMATACWAFIVAKSTLRKTAPLLDFSSLRAANIEIHQQVIHKSMWTAWG